MSSWRDGRQVRWFGGGRAGRGRDSERNRLVRPLVALAVIVGTCLAGPVTAATTAEASARWSVTAQSTTTSSTPDSTRGSTTPALATADSTTGDISGTVTDVAGVGLPGICVQAWLPGTSPETGVAAQSVASEVSGAYTLSGLAPGSYDVRYTAGCGAIGQYDEQWWEGKTTQSDAVEVSVVAGQNSPGINASMQSLTVSGTVKDSGGNPLAGICVEASDPSFNYLHATSGADGSYTITGIYDSDWTVEFRSDCSNSGNYISQWYDGASDRATATPVHVAGEPVPGIDATLQAGGSITGTVTDPNGNPAASVCVEATGPGTYASARTGTNGTYVVTGLSTGSYRVEFSDCGGNGYQPQWWDHASSADASTPVDVTAGVESAGVDAKMQPGATISGTVSEDGAAPTHCVDVFVNGPSPDNTYTSDGSYAITGLAPGSYAVQFVDCSDAYAPQWYDGASTRDSAAPVTVAAGETRSGINADLHAAASISGTVADPGGAPIPGIRVAAQYPDGSEASWTSTDPDGRYVLAGLAAGTYSVHVDDPNNLYVSSVLEVTVEAGQAASGTDVTLHTGASISGTVTDASSASVGLAGICVSAQGADFYGHRATTDSNGHYSIGGLAAGTYTVQFDDCASGKYASQWFDGQSTALSAQAVVLTDGQAKAGVDAALELGGEISGKVTAAATGAAAPDVCVSVYPATSANAPLSFGTGVSTGPQGDYLIKGLAAGSYLVKFDPCGAGVGDLTPQWFENSPSQQGATLVTVTAGGVRSGTDGALPTGGRLEGTVTDDTGHPIAGAGVFVSDGSESYRFPQTDSNGHYSVGGLVPGLYTVSFAASGFEPASYQSGTGQNAVLVQAGTTVSGIDASLTPTGSTTTPTGSIAGRVTDESGSAVAGECISIVAPQTGTFRSTSTASDGSYHLSGLPDDSYTVTAEGNAACQGGVSNDYASSNVDTSVSAGNATSDVNLVVKVGGSVAGTVTAAGSPLAGICVDASGQSGSGFARTSGDGSYRLGGLASGSYQVSFSACDGGDYLRQWYDGADSPDQAKSVAVTAGVTTSGINAVMVLGGAISGTVTDSATDTGMSGVCVQAAQSGTNGIYSTTSGPGGSYRIPALASGSYVVSFSSSCADPSAGPFLQQWYRGASSAASATSVDVTGGSTAGHVDGALIRAVDPPTVTGVSPSSGPAVGGSTVTITGTGFSTVSGGTTVHFGTAGASDVLCSSSTSCSATAPAGTGTVDVTVSVAGQTSAQTPADDFTYLAPSVSSLSPTSGPSTGGTAVAITGTGFDGSASVKFGSAGARSVTFVSPTELQVTSPGGTPGTTVNVTVTTADGTSPVVAGDHFTYTAPQPVVTSVSPANGPSTGGTSVTIGGTGFTGASTVAFGPAVASSFTVVSDTQIIAQSPSGTAAAVDVVVTTPGGRSATGAADIFSYQTPGSIQGTVTVPTGTAANGICVTATDADGARAGEAMTGSSGAYKIIGLLAGTYIVRAADPGCSDGVGLQSQWYPDAASPLGASPVQVTGGETTSGIDVTLSTGGSISGTVKDGSGGPLQDVQVCADSGPGAHGSTSTAADGSYTINGLPSGIYIVSFGWGCQDQFYDGQTTQDGATLVMVHTPTDTSGVDSVLTSASSGSGSGYGTGPGSVTGTVTDTDGAPISGICIDVDGRKGTTDVNGRYAVSGLPAGTYAVKFSIGCGTTGNYAAATKPVDVGLSPVTVDASLAPGGSISGTVTDAAGAPLAGICLSLSSGDVRRTDADGHYSVPGLAAGNYNVTVAACPGSQGSYVSQDVSVSVDAAQSVTENVALTPGAVVTGVVTDGSRQGLAGVCVRLFPAGTTGLAGEAVTDSGGSYRITGLPAGGYDVEFSSSCGQATDQPYVHQWWAGASGGVSDQASATSVDVGTGETASGIDALLSTTAPAPEITGVTPSEGPLAAGTAVTVSGSSLQGATAVYFGSQTASDVSCSGTTCTAVAPAGEGTVDVSVVTSAGTSATVDADRFTYLPVPTVSAVSPATGSSTGGDTVTVTGTGFSTAGSTKIRFGDGNATDVTCSSTTACTVTTPAGAAGPVEVSAQTPGGSTAASPAVTFTYLQAPTVSKVDPSSGPEVGGTSATITGTDFTTDGTTSVTFGGEPATDVTCASATTCTATAPAGTGTVDVVVTTPIGHSGTGATADQYTYLPVPSVTSVSPSEGPLSGDIQVTVHGTGFTGATAVSFGSTPGTDLSVLSDSELTVKAPASSAAAGVDVQVTTRGGTSPASDADTFTYTNRPVVYSVTPAAGPVAGGNTVTVRGAGFGDAPAVTFGSVAATDVQVVSDSELTAVVPAATASGSVDVTVTSAAGTSTVTESDSYAFVLAPTVTAVAPSSGPAAGGTTVTVTGTGFTGATKVEFGGRPAGSLHVDSDTQLTATSPSGSGTADVVVLGPGGSSATSSADSFSYIPSSTGGGSTGGGGGGVGGSEPQGTTTGVVPAGGSLSSDPAGTVPSAANPVVVSVTSPTAGTVSITKSATPTTLPGYLPVVSVDITAPVVNASTPLKLVFQYYLGTLPDGALPTDARIFRDGAVIAACPGSTVASPNPCVTSSTVKDGVATFVVLSSHASQWQVQARQVGRLGGANRYATAVAISQAEFAPGEAGGVVLAGGDLFPDALVGVPLAAAKHAPLLLTTGKALPGSTKTELLRVLPKGKTVYVLGGTGAVPDSVVHQLETLGYRVVRYGGKDRYATAAAVAGALGNPSTVLLASGEAFPDALTSGPAATSVRGAVLLTDGAVLPKVTGDYLATHAATVYAVGGSAAKAAPKVTGLVGADRYATAAKVAERFFPQATTVGLAAGTLFPDAVSGGSLMAQRGGPLLLSQPTAIPSSVAGYLAERRGATAHLFGGTGALSASVQTRLEKLVIG